MLDANRDIVERIENFINVRRQYGRVYNDSLIKTKERVAHLNYSLREYLEKQNCLPPDFVSTIGRAHHDILVGLEKCVEGQGSFEAYKQELISRYQKHKHFTFENTHYP